jgi:uncharacterized protein (TIGR03083 family)
VPDLRGLARAEREDLLDLLRDLSPGEWEAKSLCRGWTVRDVVAHMFSYDERSWTATVALFARGGMRFGKVNEVALRDYRDHTPQHLIELVERCLVPRGLPAGFGGGIALTDGLIHQQDIRRPLGRPRGIPGERLVAALKIASTAPTLPAKSILRGLHLCATDLDWSAGSGEEVHGPAEALLMAASGRAVALTELSGPGAATLGRRLEVPRGM